MSPVVGYFLEIRAVSIFYWSLESVRFDFPCIATDIGKFYMGFVTFGFTLSVGPFYHWIR